MKQDMQRFDGRHVARYQQGTDYVDTEPATGTHFVFRAVWQEGKFNTYIEHVRTSDGLILGCHILNLRVGPSWDFIETDETRGEHVMKDETLEKVAALLRRADAQLDTTCLTEARLELHRALELLDPQPPADTRVVTTVSKVEEAGKFAYVGAGTKLSRDDLFLARAAVRVNVVTLRWLRIPDGLRGMGRIDIDAPLQVTSCATPSLLAFRISLPGTVRAHDRHTAEQIFPGQDGEAAAGAYYKDVLLTLKALKVRVEANFRLADKESTT